MTVTVNGCVMNGIHVFVERGSDMSGGYVGDSRGDFFTPYMRIY